MKCTYFLLTMICCAVTVTAEEPMASPFSALEWWMFPVALGVFLLGGGLVRLMIRSAFHRRIGKFQSKDKTT